MAELTRRYVISLLATEAPFDPLDPDGAFVLRPWKDPAALRALKAYRDRCYPELRRDLDAWIRAIEAGPLVRGDVGRRNEPYAGLTKPASAAGPGRPAARRRSARGDGAGRARTRHGAKRASHRKKRRR